MSESNPYPHVVRLRLRGAPPPRSLGPAAWDAEICFTLEELMELRSAMAVSAAGPSPSLPEPQILGLARKVPRASAPDRGSLASATPGVAAIAAAVVEAFRDQPSDVEAEVQARVDPDVEDEVVLDEDDVVLDMGPEVEPRSDVGGEIEVQPQTPGTDAQAIWAEPAGSRSLAAEMTLEPDSAHVEQTEPVLDDAYSVEAEARSSCPGGGEMVVPETDREAACEEQVLETTSETGSEEGSQEGACAVSEAAQVEAAHIEEAIPDLTQELGAELQEEGRPGPPPTPNDRPGSREAGEPRSPTVMPWFEEVFGDDYLRTLPFLGGEQTRLEASFIEESLAVPRGGRILDVGCGYGRHAVELASRGYQVVGLDRSEEYLGRAAAEAAQRGVAADFVLGDMRDMGFEANFDGAYCFGVTFGYFDDEGNRRAARSVAQALRPGGRFLVELVNRDHVVGDLPARGFWQGRGCLVVDELDFDFYSSRLTIHRSLLMEDSRQIEREIAIRAYTVQEAGKLLFGSGFVVRAVSGSIYCMGRFFGKVSPSLILLAVKKDGDGGVVLANQENAGARTP